MGSAWYELLSSAGDNTAYSYLREPKPNVMTRSLGIALLLSPIFFSACSLLNVELKAETNPFTTREMNVRVRMQEFARDFSQSVETAADSILQAETSTVEQQVNALLWKINATSASRQAVFQTIPSIAAVDTWVLCRQMSDLMAGPQGEAYFGSWQPFVAATAMELDRSIEEVAAELVEPYVFEDASQFIEGYTDTVRLQDLSFQRVRIYSAWNGYRGIPDSLAVQTVGSLPQVFDNATVQLSELGSALPKQSKWQLELLQKQYGNDTIAVFQTMDSIALAINRISRIVESPELMDTTMLRLRAELVPLVEGMREQWDYTMLFLGRERLAATDSLKVQSQAIMVGLDSLSTRIVDRAIGRAMDGLPAVIGQATLLIVVITVALIGLPFIMGLTIGRLSMRKKLKA